MPNVVLITGVSRYLGARLAAQLAADPSIERVIGVDTVPPAQTEVVQLGRTEFVRADIRNPLIAKVLTQARVDTVVHASVLPSARGIGNRFGTKELNLIGTMQLLAAGQKSDTLTRFVLASTTSVYGSSPRDPAVFTEDMQAVAAPQSGYAEDAIEVEGYVRGFQRRRADVTVSVLRFASLVGPAGASPLCRYLAMPAVPTALGFDPRLQLLHESDAVEVLRLATVSDRPGVVNVAADGVVLLSQAIRRAGRTRIPVPAGAVAPVGRMLRDAAVSAAGTLGPADTPSRAAGMDFAAQQGRYLSFGRVVDTARLHEQFGYQPRYSTDEALASFLASLPAPRAAVPGVAALLPRAARALRAQLAAQIDGAA